MCPAICHERSCLVIINSYNAHESSCGEVLATLLNIDCQKLIWFTWIWARVNWGLGLRFSYIPVSDFSVLANTEELIGVSWWYGEAVDASHSQGLVWDPLLILEIPAKNGLVSWAGKQMNIISEYLHLCHFACVFLQMRYELPGPNLPDSDFAFMTSRNNKLWIIA